MTPPAPGFIHRGQLAARSAKLAQFSACTVSRTLPGTQFPHQQRSSRSHRSRLLQLIDPERVKEIEREGGYSVIYASLATAHITSIWLWLAVIFTPIVRLVVWSRTTGLTAVGRILDAERKPMVALGYVTTLLILACGGTVWGIGRAMAAFAN